MTEEVKKKTWGDVLDEIDSIVEKLESFSKLTLALLRKRRRRRARRQRPTTND